MDEQSKATLDFMERHRDSGMSAEGRAADDRLLNQLRAEAGLPPHPERDWSSWKPGTP